MFVEFVGFDLIVEFDLTMRSLIASGISTVARLNIYISKAIKAYYLEC
jgi:hypothetical protein